MTGRRITITESFHQGSLRWVEATTGEADTVIATVVERTGRNPRGQRLLTAMLRRAVAELDAWEHRTFTTVSHGWSDYRVGRDEGQRVD